MSNDLYFISTIARALRGPDVEMALIRAFHEIKAKDAGKHYTDGFRNFERFMDIAYSHHGSIVTDCTRELIADTAAGMSDSAGPDMKRLLDVINLRPEWKAEYQRICQAEADESLTRDPPVFAISSTGRVDISRAFTQVPGRVVFDGIVPGNYKIRLINTGWTIWAGKLTAKQLVWTSLPMAAESGNTA